MVRLTCTGGPQAPPPPGRLAAAVCRHPGHLPAHPHPHLVQGHQVAGGRGEVGVLQLLGLGPPPLPTLLPGRTGTSWMATLTFPWVSPPVPTWRQVAWGPPTCRAVSTSTFSPAIRRSVSMENLPTVSPPTCSRSLTRKSTCLTWWHTATLKCSSHTGDRQFLFTLGRSGWRGWRGWGTRS